MTTTKIILIDPSRCCGCGRCEYACSLNKEGVISLAMSRMHLVRMPDNAVSFPSVCQQCKVPLCTFACPTGAISANRETGVVTIDPEVCVGCLQCFLACPFGGISISNERLPIKCDQCGGEPRCVEACEYNAILFLDASQADSLKKKKGSIEPLFMMKP